MATANTQSVANREWWRRPAPAPAPTDASTSARPEAWSSVWSYRALLAFVLVNVLSPQAFIPALEPLRLAFLAALAAIGTHLIDRWSGKSEPVRQTMVSVLIWSLVVWGIVTVPASIWPGGSLAIIVSQYLKVVVIFWLIASVITTTERLRMLFWTLTLVSAPIALTAMANFQKGVSFQDSDRVEGYKNGLSSNPNDLALTLNMITPLAVVLALTTRSRAIRLTCIGIIALNVLGVIVSFSRGGFVTLALIAMQCVVLLGKRRHWTLIGVGVLALAMAVPFLPAGYLDRLSTIKSVESDPTGSAQERVAVMLGALESVKAHPLIGTGLGTDALAVQAVRGFGWLRVHNTYLNYAVDLGLPGLTLFVAALISGILTVRAIEKRPPLGADDDLPMFATGLRISLVSFAVAIFFSPVAYNFYFYYLIGMAVAAGNCAVANRKLLKIA